MSVTMKDLPILTADNALQLLEQLFSGDNRTHEDFHKAMRHEMEVIAKDRGGNPVHCRLIEQNTRTKAARLGTSEWARACRAGKKVAQVARMTGGYLGVVVEGQGLTLY